MNQLLHSICIGALFFAAAALSAQAPQYRFQLSPPQVIGGESFFEENTTAVLDFGMAGSRIFITLDGSDPDEHASRYRQPLQITHSCTLKARVYHDCCQMSEVISRSFRKVQRQNPSRIALDKNPSPQYPGAGAVSLFDLKKGSADFHEPAWLGFNGDDLVITLAWDQPRPLHSLTLSTISDPASWIFPPKGMEVYASEDGKQFQLIGQQDYPALTKAGDPALLYFSLSFPEQVLNFIKIVVYNTGKLPDWHPGAGSPAWLFVDEILLNDE